MSIITNGLAFLSGAAIFVFLLIWISCMIDKVLEARKKPVTDDVEARWRHYLKESAHWFSEDIPTMRLITWLAERSNVATVREKWRAERAAASPPVIMQANVAVPGMGQSQIHAGPAVMTSVVPPDSLGAWKYGAPHFVDSEDCMANKEAYWRVWGARGAEMHVGFGTTPAQAMADCVHKCEGGQAAIKQTEGESQPVKQSMFNRTALGGLGD